MILKNPTPNDITVKIDGQTHSIMGHGTLEVSERVGNYWKKKLHNFLQVSSPDVTVETPEPTEVTSGAVKPGAKKNTASKNVAKKNTANDKSTDLIPGAETTNTTSYTDEVIGLTLNTDGTVVGESSENNK